MHIRKIGLEILSNMKFLQFTCSITAELSETSDFLLEATIPIFQHNRATTCANEVVGK